MTQLQYFAILAPAALIGLGVGGGIGAALGLAPSMLSTWLLVGAGLLIAMAAASLIMTRRTALPRAIPEPPTAPNAEDARLEAHRRLRHDIRGALSPALLTADRLLNHADPAVQRAGDIMVRAIEKAAALLSDPAGTGATPHDPS